MSDLPDLRRRLLAEARAMQDDQRYGAWTNPVMLGLLTAVDLAAPSPSPHPTPPTGETK